jgi:hypothetical protein
LKLKTDADGNKTTTVNGIRSACKIMKTRYAKPFESVQVEIPYTTGMAPTSGLVDLFEAKGVLTKSGNKLQYISKTTGEVQSHFRKQWTEDRLKLIMDELVEPTVDITIVEESEEA